MRRFEYVGGNSSKFWEITSGGKKVLVRYGRLGGKPQMRAKVFGDPSAAQRHAENLIRAKTAKGYVECVAR